MAKQSAVRDALLNVDQAGLQKRVNDPAQVAQLLQNYSPERKNEAINTAASGGFLDNAVEGFNLIGSQMSNAWKGGAKDQAPATEKPKSNLNNNVVGADPAVETKPVTTEDKPKEDSLTGLKNFFWDKDKGGVTGHGLLTLGVLARAIAGQREKNAGMTGGGMESAGVGQAMTGAFQGMNERNRQLELDKLAREKIEADKAIAAAKEDKKPAKVDPDDKSRKGIISKMMGISPDFVTPAKVDEQLAQSGIDVTKYPNKWDAWAAYWDKQSPAMGQSFRNMYGVNRPGGTNAPALPPSNSGNKPNPAGI